MSSPNNTTTTITNCQFNDDRLRTSISFYCLNSFMLFFCLYAISANIILLYKRGPKEFWIENGHRCIFVCCSAANITAAIAQACRCLLDFVWAGMVNDDWSRVAAIYVAETALMTVMLAMSMVAFQNAYVIKRYLSSFDASNFQSDKRLIWLSSFFGLILVAFSCTLLGFSAHNENGLVQLPYVICQSVRAVIYVLLPFIVAGAVLKTRKMCDQLQQEFAVRRAQQTLQLRVTLRRVLKRTKLLLPLFIFHVIWWMVLITADISVDIVFSDQIDHPNNNNDNNNNVTDSDSDRDNDSDENCYFDLTNGGKNSIWETSVDTGTMLYCALFPIVLSTRKTVRERLKQIIFCGLFSEKGSSDIISHSTRNNKVQPKPSMSIFSLSVSRAWFSMESEPKNQQQQMLFQRSSRYEANHSDGHDQDSHWRAMNNQWNMVKLQFNKNSN